MGENKTIQMRITEDVYSNTASVRRTSTPKFCLKDFEAKLEEYKKDGVDPWGSYDDFDVDFTQDYPPRRCTLDIGGTMCFPIGNIVGIQAKYKNGKSTLSCLLTAALLGNNKFGIRSLVPNAKVIIFDTEQELSDSVGLGNTVNSLLGRAKSANYPDFRVKHIRQQQPEENWNYIKLVSEWMRPTAIVIDGINDLVFAPNDEETSIKVIAEMNAFAERNEMVIFAIIHENKSDTNPQGFMGTQLLKKAADMVKVEFKDETKDFRVSQLFARGHEKFQDFYFKMGENGIPEETIHEEVDGKELETKQKIASILNKVYDNCVSLRRNELERKYMEAAKDLGIKKVADRTARNHITKALSYDILHVDSGIYYLNDGNEPF